MADNVMTHGGGSYRYQLYRLRKDPNVTAKLNTKLAGL